MMMLDGSSPCNHQDMGEGRLDTIPTDSNGLVLYFAYGSNLCDQQLVDRVGPPAYTHAACLLDHEVVFDKLRSPTADDAFANVVPKQDAVTMGKVYALTEVQLDLMDDYEAAPMHYSRLAMPVRIYDDEGDNERIARSTDFNSIRKRGTDRVCAVYVANPSYRTPTPLRPSKNYLRKLLLGGPLVPRWYTMWLAGHAVAASSSSEQSSPSTFGVGN